MISAHIRLTRTSSDLRALLSLVPPSPILTPSQLSTTFSSGDIPIILDFSVDPFTSACSVQQPEIHGHDSFLNLHADDSITTINTIGTFGPVQDRFPDRYSSASTTSFGLGLHHNGGIASLVGGSVLEIPQLSRSRVNSDYSLSTEAHPVVNQYISTGDEVYTDGRFPISPSGNQVPEHADSHRAFGSSSEESLRNTSSAFPHNIKDKEGQTLFLAHSQTIETFSTLPTPSFAPPTSSSYDSFTSPFPSHRHRNRRPLERAGAIHQRHSFTKAGNPEGGSPRSSSFSPLLKASFSGSCSSPPPITRGFSAAPHHRRSDSASTATSAWSCPSVLVNVNEASSEMAPSFSKFGLLPKSLSWFKDITIDLWIDQEGFRAIKPSFKLVGYSPRGRSLEPYSPVLGDGGTDPTAGVAEFMPIKRETFVFHYATLDGAPILRRLTTGGDEARDYISRHASLNMKTNGVYTVRGLESSSLPPGGSENNGSRCENIKLKWKFDYIVDDRRVDATKKIMHGEKTLTPLTFSCSPLLLHPLQGKKIGLMHIVKKSVVAKVVAEKIQPPKFPGKGKMPSPQLHPTLKPDLLIRTHSRSWSDAHPKAPYSGRPSGAGTPMLGSPLGPSIDGFSKVIDGRKQIQYTHRRRASSAGERGTSGTSRSIKPNPTGQHIVSPSRLTELLASNSKGTSRSDLGMKMLSPPRHGNPKLVSRRAS